MGKDHTIFAVEDGVVKFDRSSVRARICVVAEEEFVPTKDTARARKFAKCVPAQQRVVRRAARALRFAVSRCCGARNGACAHAQLFPVQVPPAQLRGQGGGRCRCPLNTPAGCPC